MPMRVIALLSLILASSGCAEPAETNGKSGGPDGASGFEPATTTTPATATTSPTTTPTGPTGDTAAGTEEDWYDCSDLGPLPPPIVTLTGLRSSEDFAFTTDGAMISHDNGQLWRSEYPPGTETILTPASGFVAGIRTLPSGDIVYADVVQNALVRVDSAGVKTPLVNGLAYPNGIEIHKNGMVYVAEQSGHRVRRVDPDTGEYMVVIDGDVREPNGLSFSADWTKLYVGGFSGQGKVYQLPVDADGLPTGPVTVFAENVGSGWLDGMAVDACNNVYVADYGQSRIYRIYPDGSGADLFMDPPTGGSYMPNFQWGSGVGGWDPRKLYVSEMAGSKFYEVDIGVPDKPR
jgi:hypothetical protein